MKARDASGRSSCGLFAFSDFDVLGDQAHRASAPVAACPEAPRHRVGDPQQWLGGRVHVLVGQFRFGRPVPENLLDGLPVTNVAIFPGVQHEPVRLETEQVSGDLRKASLPGFLFGLPRAGSCVEPCGDVHGHDAIYQEPASRFLFLLEMQFSSAAEKKRLQRTASRCQLGGLDDGDSEQVLPVPGGFVDKRVHGHLSIIAPQRRHGAFGSTLTVTILPCVGHRGRAR